VSWIDFEVLDVTDGGFQFEGSIRDWVLMLDWVSTRGMDQMEDNLNISGELVRTYSRNDFLIISTNSSDPPTPILRPAHTKREAPTRLPVLPSLPLPTRSLPLSSLPLPPALIPAPTTMKKPTKFQSHSNARRVYPRLPSIDLVEHVGLAERVRDVLLRLVSSSLTNILFTDDTVNPQIPRSTFGSNLSYDARSPGTPWSVHRLPCPPYDVHRLWTLASPYSSPSVRPYQEEPRAR
jgi:hypothetical protein